MPGISPKGSQSVELTWFGPPLGSSFPFAPFLSYEGKGFRWRIVRKRSRARRLCAAKRTLYGEDDSLTLVGEGKGRVPRSKPHRKRLNRSVGMPDFAFAKEQKP